jgi:eukaryotic-like serine/threonine-protein kinase
MGEPLTNTSQCHTCGHAIADTDLAGLCPSCVFGLAVGEEPTPSPNANRGLLNILGYEVREEIARGGMGIVYRALQLEPRREVALKMLLPHQATSPGMLERFHLEARAIAALEHPAILPVHHVGEHKGLPFFTMKLADGGSLAQREDRFVGKWRDVGELIATLADAVQFAHERGVLHRDLKPGNVLFDEAGRAYVSDFGLAKLVDTDADLTRSVDLLGTPHYIAPEVAAHSAKDATTASDIYSLGAILYELLAGRPPFEAEGIPALLKKIAEEEPVTPRLVAAGVSRRLPSSVSSGLTDAATSVPRDLEVICLKCLAKEPSRRYATARELADDLRRWMEGRTILARPATRLERVHSWARRNPALATVSAVLAVVLVAGIIWEARSNRQLQQALSESLLRQAQLERSSRHAGQRFETLALVSRAAGQLSASGKGMSRSNLVALRSEVAAALALPDFRPIARWRVHVANLDNEFDFTANLDRYASLTSDGGFQVALTANQFPIYRIAGATNNPVIKLRLHPNGSWVAARFRDGHAELHSLNKTNRLAHRWRGVPNTGALFDFAPSGDLFAVVVPVSREQRLTEIIDLNRGVTNARVPPGNATTLAFDSTGTHLALAGAELAIWRLADTNLLWSAPLSHEASAVAWSANGARLAVALERRKPIKQERLLKACPVIVFDTASAQQESIFGEFNDRVARLAFHPAREWLIAATWSGGLTSGSVEWDSARLFTESAQRALKFSTDGKRLGYAPTLEELGLLDVAMPGAFRAWRSDVRTEEAFTMAVSADGKWGISASGTSAHLWDATAREEIESRTLPAKSFWVETLFGEHNEHVYVSAVTFGVRRWTLTNGPDGRPRFGEERIIGEPKGLVAIRFADDQRSLVVGDHRQRGTSAGGPTVWLWPEADPTRARKLAGDFPLSGYSVVPRSRWAVTTAMVQPDAWIWDFETGERLRSLGLAGRASSKATANGRWLMARTRDEFGVWEVGTWKRLARWPARPDEASMNLFSSPDSRLIATHNPTGRFVLRELPKGDEVILLTPPHPISVQYHQFSPDGRRLLFMGNNGQMFDWDLGEIRRELAKLGLDW